MSLMAKFLGQPIRANILASDFSMVGLYKKQEISDIFDRHNPTLRIYKEINVRSPVMPTSRKTLQSKSISASI
jgi:hypothetical protein